MVSPSPSVDVVEEVARTEGVSPTELTPPLTTVVDTDALDVLVGSGDSSTVGSVEIEFEYRGHVVRVRNGPTVGVSVDVVAPSTVDAGAVPKQNAGSGQ